MDEFKKSFWQAVWRAREAGVKIEYNMKIEKDGEEEILFCDDLMEGIQRGYPKPRYSEEENADSQKGTDSVNKKWFYERHPNLPMWISLAAIIAMIAMPIIRKVLGQMP